MFSTLLEKSYEVFAGKHMIARDNSDSDSGSEACSPLSSKSAQNVVEELPGCRSTPNAHVVANGPKEGDLETVACPPLELTVTLSEKYKAGQLIGAEGPHGEISINHPGAKAGDTLNFKLAPPADMTITIPKDYKKGDKLFFDRCDGARVGVGVPSDMGPGDKFDVFPPALMVKVPEGAQPGDSVVFRRDGEKSDWLRAHVPKDLGIEGYFAVRLPVLGPCAQGQQGATEEDSESDDESSQQSP